jgi:hypothetical protein
MMLARLIPVLMITLPLLMMLTMTKAVWMLLETAKVRSANRMMTDDDSRVMVKQ